MVSHDDQVELAGFLAYDCTVLLAMFVAFVRHWDRTPIRERHPTIVIVIEVLVALIPYSDWVVSQYPGSVMASLVGVVIFDMTPLHGTLLRTMFLYCNYRRTKAKVLLSATGVALCPPVVDVATSNAGQGQPGRVGQQRPQVTRVDVFFAAHPFLVRETFWFKAFLGCIVADLVVIAVTYAMCSGMATLPASFTSFNNGATYLHLILMVVFIVRLGNCHDAFHIKFEITTNAVLGFVAAIVIDYVIPPAGDVHSTTKRLATWLLTKVTTSVSLLLPVCWARRGVTRVGPQYGRMDRLLDVDVVRMAFTEYLQKEFAVESMLFYEARRQFTRKWSRAVDRTPLSVMTTLSEQSHSSASMAPEWAVPVGSVPGELVDDAYAIYKTFIKVGAPFEINISSGLRRAYEALFEPDRVEQSPAGAQAPPAEFDVVDKAMFDRAWGELRHMLEYAAFQRFLETDIAADILKMG
ncbi:RGS domain-containing protein [Plasmodiophora brassicae]|uniref:RGS domain-containing protein n=1 Tax=Plasmodiophora brassicae TaxID=37360 RepID=A0A0G4IXY3_PLABS|nr:hypothetical protein PBRA_007894 [Plasmodiophora brassicae]SPQ98966.1 unnamed protein product [Plasmodiophora brassicae]